MKTTDAVRGKWSLVFEYYGLPPLTGKKHFKGECPLCKNKGCFRFDDKSGNGDWICKCDSGTGWQLLEATQGKDFKTLCKEVDSIIGNTYEGTGKPISNEEKSLQGLRNKILRLYPELDAIKGSQVEQYFLGRGISVTPPEWVKFKKIDGQAEIDGAIYSIATDSRGKPCYLHRTFLKGAKKADIEKPKKMKSLQAHNYLDHTTSIAIRMFQVSSTLGIAEGIETALSCTQIYKCHTWSTLNAALMKKFRAPKGVNHLIIFADCDRNGTGHAAAFECGNRNILSDNDVSKVTIRWPERGDFNDVLKDGLKVYEWVLRGKE